MKSLLISFLVVMLLAPAGVVFAQNSAIKETPEYRRQMMVYNLSKRYNDYSVTRTALYNMIAMDPSDMSLLDSLALVYYDFDQFAPLAMVTNDAIGMNPNNLLAVELNAMAYENLGLRENALTRYETLNLKEPSIELLYKIAFLQFELERYNECRTTIKLLNEEPSASTELIQYESTVEGETITVPMTIATKNLLALVNEAEGNRAEAVRLFQEVLNQYPNFRFVKETLAQLKN